MAKTNGRIIRDRSGEYEKYGGWHKGESWYHAEDFKHAGRIRKGYFAKCKCGFKGKLKLYRYKAMSDLLKHFRRVRTLDDLPEKDWFSLGHVEQQHKRYLLGVKEA